MLGKWFRTFRRDDDAQDLVEYTLLIGFLAMAAVGVMSQLGVTIQGPWSTAQTTLAVANATPTTPPSGDGHGDHDGR
jgi:Flp pilus assembly pilin Flp